MNHLMLIHNHKSGSTLYNFITSRSYQEIDDVIGQWFGFNAGASIPDAYDSYQKSACKKLCDALDLDFEPWREDEYIELLTVHNYETEIVNLDEKFPTLPQDDV